MNGGIQKVQGGPGRLPSSGRAKDGMKAQKVEEVWATCLASRGMQSQASQVKKVRVLEARLSTD